MGLAAGCYAAGEVHIESLTRELPARKTQRDLTALGGPSSFLHRLLAATAPESTPNTYLILEPRVSNSR